MKITLSVDERTFELACTAALAMGKSLERAVQDQLEQLGGSQQLTVHVLSFERSALSTPGRLAHWKFDREEVNRRAWLAE